MSTHFRNAVDAIKRAPFQAIAAIGVLTITFFVATIISILVYSSSQLLNYFETRPQVIAFLKNDVKEDATAALRRKLEGDLRIKDLKFVSKEEALDLYKKATADNPLLAELVSPSIFPASFEFSVTDLSLTTQVIDEVKKEGIVDSVGFTASIGGQTALNDVIDRLKKITFYVRAGGLGLSASLGFASFLVLMVVVGMRITTKRTDLETLKLMGATPGFIRAPILWEAIIYGVVGAFLGWLFGIILILYATPSVLSYFTNISVLPRNTLQFFTLLLVILGIEVVIAAFIAIIGSWVAVSRATSK